MYGSAVAAKAFCLTNENLNGISQLPRPELPPAEDPSTTIYSRFVSGSRGRRVHGSNPCEFEAHPGNFEHRSEETCPTILTVRGRDGADGPITEFEERVKLTKSS